jgi:hypothetical protein
MSKGALLFALNNSEINYIKLAEFAAERIKKHLSVPVSIVTDEKSLSSVSSNVFDKIITVDSEKYLLKTFNDGLSKSAKTEWKNSHRNSSFDLTPYDETLVVDVDFVINSNVLTYCWNQPHDFLIYKKSFDLAQRKDTREFAVLSDYSIPFYWATVFWFKKTELNEQLFSIISHIKSNWHYYKFQYQIHSHSFRNDYAFSIAIHMMNGFADSDFAKSLPGKMYYTLDTDILIKQHDNSLFFLTQSNTNQYTPLKISNVDVHVMNKYSLLRIIENE